MKYLIILLLFLTSCISADESSLENFQAPVANFASKNHEALNKALQFYEQAALKDWPELASEGCTLKIGNKNSNIKILKARLIMSGDLTGDPENVSNIFDKNTLIAVKNFQTRHGLKADGIVGAKTRTELNVCPQARVDQIKINLQRWANLQSQVGDHFILVNVPDYRLYLIDDNKVVMQMKTIVGKRTRETPDITSTISKVIFYPYWRVPPTIATKDMPGKMRDNPNYLNEMNFKVYRIKNNQKYSINPNSINWQTFANNTANYLLQQDPGPNNALGLVKFEFQNSHSIYLHDTPTKNLFNADLRNLSSGCVRLEKPFDLAEYLLKDNEEWDSNSLQKILAARKTVYRRPARPMPIFISYLTAWVDENGLVNFRDDVYDKDDKPITTPNSSEIDQLDLAP